MLQRQCSMTLDTTELVEALRIRARIRRQIPSRKSVQEGKPDRLADLLDEAANHIVYLEERLREEYKSNPIEL